MPYWGPAPVGLTSLMRTGEDTIAGYVGGSFAFSNGNLLLHPFPIPRAVTATRIGVDITSGGSAGSVVRSGIYADDGTGKPGALILDAGTVVGTGTGLILATISQVLSPPFVWVGAVNQGAPASTATLGYFNIGALPGPFGGGGYFQAWSTTGVTGALPASGSAFVRDNTPIVVSLRAA